MYDGNRRYYLSLFCFDTPYSELRKWQSKTQIVYRMFRYADMMLRILRLQAYNWFML